MLRLTKRFYVLQEVGAPVRARGPTWRGWDHAGLLTQVTLAGGWLTAGGRPHLAGNLAGLAGVGRWHHQNPAGWCLFCSEGGCGQTH